MSRDTVERCDVCGEDTHKLSFERGTRVYRGRFKEGGFFWKGREDRAPEGEIAICSECWRELGAAVRARREAQAKPL